MREIAAKAGLSPAAVLYHYPENGDLLLAVHQAVVEDYLDLRHSAQQAHADPRVRLTSVFRSGLPSLTESKAIRLLFELHGLARQDAAHAELMTLLWQREIALYEEIITAGQEVDLFAPAQGAHEVATALLGLEDGLALHLTSDNRALSDATCLNILHYAAAELLRCSRWDS